MRIHIESPGLECSRIRFEVNYEKRLVSAAHLVDPRFQEAKQYLLALDPTTDCFTFQTFDDAKERRDPHLARIVHGKLADHASELTGLNARGAGVFVAVNATNFKGRGTRHITRVRAVWQDDDAQWTGDFPIDPSIVARTSPCRFQRYWLCDGLTFSEHQSVMDRISRDFGNDPNAKDLARVLRLPGFWHMKNPNAPHLVRIVGGHRQRYSAAQILVAFSPIEKPPAVPRHQWRPRTYDDRRIRDALRRIPANEREVWLRVGMALCDHYGKTGRAIWDEWSATSEKFDPKAQERIWRSFGRGGVGVGTIFYLAGTYTNVA